ncbi:hypothetical protein LCGC14_2418150 [marine sediment metagenome]|uniref:VRR-NUC domain-containing protein n=1 Tax=marine sediment metagenome TaxID=412755 RepID=A0A0F9BQK2_9ZZZZ
MPKKNVRPDARRDANEPEIVDELERKGYLVHRIAGPGDLLVWNHHTDHWIVLEVKVIDGRLTPKQRTYRKDHPEVDIPIVITANQALNAILTR